MAAMTRAAGQPLAQVLRGAVDGCLTVQSIPDSHRANRAEDPMRLTQWTDYSLRVLMYCAACEGRDFPPTVSEIAEAHGISRSHLTKIVMILAACGWLATTRGRGGGLRLLKPARELSLGEIVRRTETDMTLVECFDRETNTCRLDGYCRLKDALYRAQKGFLDVLDGVTLADLLAPVALNPAHAGQLPHLIPIQFASLKMPRQAPGMVAEAGVDTEAEAVTGSDTEEGIAALPARPQRRRGKVRPA